MPFDFIPHKSFISCWLSIEKGTIWAFAAPVVLIMMVSNIAKCLIVIHGFIPWQVNIVFLLIVMVVLVRKGRSKLPDGKDAKNQTIVV